MWIVLNYFGLAPQKEASRMDIWDIFMVTMNGKSESQTINLGLITHHGFNGWYKKKKDASGEVSGYIKEE